MLYVLGGCHDDDDDDGDLTVILDECVCVSPRKACMDATQQIEDSFFGEEDDSDEEHEDGEGKGQRRPLAVLKVFKNNHIPETGAHSALH